MNVSENYTIVGYNSSGKSFLIRNVEDSAGKTKEEIDKLVRTVIAESSLGLSASIVAGLTLKIDR